MAIGRIAAITVNVANIVGLPTSSTAETAVSGETPFMLKCLCIFSTTTMASSTSMPMEKIKEKSVHIIDQDRQCEGDRHRNGNDKRFLNAQRDRYEDRY